MSLKAIPPGARKGNRYYVLRGTVDGQRVEIATELPAGTAPGKLRGALQEAEREVRTRHAEHHIPRPGEDVTFSQAARLYAAWRDPNKADIARIARLETVLGRQLIQEIGQADLVAAAEALYPARPSSTRNREVLRPAAAILHYAADAKLMPWLRVRLFKEPKPKTRAVSIDTASALVQAAPAGPKRMFLVWSFRMGTRISDTLAVEWRNIDLPRQVVMMRIGKRDLDRVEKPLHPEVFELLASTPQEDRVGRLFPWGQKTGVYAWLRPLTRELGIAFTPHMARHSLGTWLNEDRAGLRTIMAALDHADPKSSIRYQSADVEIVRAAAARLAPLSGGPTGQTAAKARKA